MSTSTVSGRIELTPRPSVPTPQSGGRRPPIKTATPTSNRLTVIRPFGCSRPTIE
jgi:hypothetical protein